MEKQFHCPTCGKVGRPSPRLQARHCDTCDLWWTEIDPGGNLHRPDPYPGIDRTARQDPYPQTPTGYTATTTSNGSVIHTKKKTAKPGAQTRWDPSYHQPGGGMFTFPARLEDENGETEIYVQFSQPMLRGQICAVAAGLNERREDNPHEVPRIYKRLERNMRKWAKDGWNFGGCGLEVVLEDLRTAR